MQSHVTNSVLRQSIYYQGEDAKVKNGEITQFPDMPPNIIFSLTRLKQSKIFQTKDPQERIIITFK